MTLPLPATIFPGILSLGHLRLPVFGFFAAAGLVAALLLSQRTAKLAALDPIKLWDASLFAVMASFVLSRLLLVARDPHAFLRYPLLVLALPSLTYLAMALSVIAVVVYLRARQMPLLRVLDAWAPCAALLAAALAAGHFVEGTDAGMPTHLPWGIVAPGDPSLGRVHPVQLYALVGAFLLCAGLLRGLALSRHLPLHTGSVAALGLTAGGVLALLLAVFMQPTETRGSSWLEPGQIIAVGAIAAGTALFFRGPPPVPKQIQEQR